MSSEKIVQLVGANPGPAAHLALLGILVLIGLVILAVTRRRRGREAQSDEWTPPDITTGTDTRTDEADPVRGPD